jgi:predicted Zn-dependent protease
MSERSSEQAFKNALEYNAQGKITASVIELKNALKQEPGNTTLRISLGEIYLRVRDLSRAEREFRQALSDGAHPDEVYKSLAQIWQLQGHYWQILRQLSPDGLTGLARTDVFVARARAHAGLGQTLRAQQALETALQIMPHHVDAWIETTRIAIQQNDVGAATHALATLHKLAANNLEVEALQGDLYLKTGQFPQAASQYEAVLKRLPAHVLTKVALADAYLKLGRDAPAAGLIDEALQQTPNNLEANYLKAAMAMKRDDYGLALKHAERALLSNGSHLPSLLIAGEAEVALGRLVRAELKLQKVRASVPDHDAANRLLTTIDERRAIGEWDQSLTFLIDDSAAPVTVASAIDPKVADRQALQIGLTYLEKVRQSRTHSQSGSDIRPQSSADDHTEFEIARLEIELAQKPYSARLRTLLGQAYLSRNRAEEAYQLTATNFQREDSGSENLTIAAIASLLTKRPDLARLALRSLEDIEPSAVETHYLLAVTYDRLGNIQARQRRLDQGLELDPNFAPAIAERARLALAENRLAAAETDIRKLEELWPRRPEYFDLAGGLALLRDTAPNATLLYRRAFKAQPTAFRVLRLAYGEHRSGRAAESQKVLLQWLREHPDETVVALSLANKYLEKEDLVEAAELYSIILRQTPDQIVALNNLAWVSSQLGDLANAEKLARRGLELSPDNSRLMDTLADIQVRSGKYDEALSLLKRALKQDQANLGLQVKLAKTLAQTGGRAEARDLLQHILDDDREFPERGEAAQLSAELNE